MTLATMLRKARGRTRLSLRQVAGLASCSPSHLSRVETGQITPSRKLLIRLSAVLDVKFEALTLAMGRVPEDVANWIAANPSVIAKLRRMQRRKVAA